MAKQLLSLLMCLCLIVGYSYKEPVHATGVELVFGGLAAGATGAAATPVVGGLLVAGALTAAGIGVSALVHGESYQDACVRVWNNVKAKAAPGILFAGIAAKPVIQYKDYAMTAILAGWQAVTGDRLNYEKMQLLPATSIAGTITAVDLFTKFGFSNYWIQFPSYTKPADVTMVDTQISIDVSTITTPRVFPLTNNKYVIVSNFYDSESKVFRPTFSIITSTSVPILPTNWHEAVAPSTSRTEAFTSQFPKILFLSAALATGGTWFGFMSYNTATSQAVLALRQDPAVRVGNWSIGEDVINLADKMWYAKEMSVMNNSISELLSRLIGLQKQISDGICVYPKVGVGTNPTVQDYDDTRYRDQTDVLDLPKDVVTPDDRVKDEATNTDRDTTLPSNPPGNPPKPSGLPDISLPTLITRKFPFSIPWDLAAIVGTFYPVDRKAPYFEIPLENSRLGIHEKIIIDLSNFEPVANVARWFEFIGYALGLILITRKIIGAGGSD